MKTINIINAISIHLLVAILLQYFIVGMFTYSMMDFSGFKFITGFWKSYI
jgi:hypothetical protein